MLRSLLVVLVAAVVLVSIGNAASVTAKAPPKLQGTIGPGFTISLKNAQGKAVKTIKHGKYTLVVQDKADIHNFTLNGRASRTRWLPGLRSSAKSR